MPGRRGAAKFSILVIVIYHFHLLVRQCEPLLASRSAADITFRKQRADDGKPKQPVMALVYEQLAKMESVPVYRDRWNFHGTASFSTVAGRSTAKTAARAWPVIYLSFLHANCYHFVFG